MAVMDLRGFCSDAERRWSSAQPVVICLHAQKMRSILDKGENPSAPIPSKNPPSKKRQVFKFVLYRLIYKVNIALTVCLSRHDLILTEISQYCSDSMPLCFFFLDHRGMVSESGLRLVLWFLRWQYLCLYLCTLLRRMSFGV